MNHLLLLNIYLCEVDQEEVAFLSPQRETHWNLKASGLGRYQIWGDKKCWIAYIAESMTVSRISTIIHLQKRHMASL